MMRRFSKETYKVFEWGWGREILGESASVHFDEGNNHMYSLCFCSLLVEDKRKGRQDIWCYHFKGHNKGSFWTFIGTF